MLDWDWEAHAERLGLRPDPIKVQGVTVNPGDVVLVLIAGDWVRRTYIGLAPNGDAQMNVEKLTRALDQLPGPFPLERLRHPNFLEGFAKEIDATD